MRPGIARRASSLALALALAACTPATGAPTVAPNPPPATDFSDGVSRIERRQAADDSVAATGARSILLSHGRATPRVFVLLHGFTDSPTQFLVLGERLFAAGDNVYLPRLPHHADRMRRVRELGRVQAEELASFGDSAIDAAHALGDSIIVVGLSAGGAIAAHLAQTREDVLRAILVAPAIGAGHLSDDEQDGLIQLASRLPDITRSEAADTTRPDFIQGLTTRGLAQVLRLGRTVRDEADVHRPRAGAMAVVLNELDQTVSEDASIDLARRWARHGGAVQLYSFPASAGLPHNVMEVPQRGGNLELVLPVLEALAYARTPPTVRSMDIPCDGFECVVIWWHRRRGE
ncbi:MAG TPA: alpha/beta fold hydrolase [Gemmatimonadaceae bacterium]|jgi:carboxylesterase|nr:alpha/beta fold hydrolase [Gemmatimonadaceae bacterium]